MNTGLISANDAHVERINVLNVDGSGSITTGMAVCLVQAGASIDGISAIKSTAGTWEGFIGIALGDIAINGYGTVQTFGFCNSILLSNVGSSLTITRGDFLKPGAVAGTLFSSLTDEALSTLDYKYIVAATTPAAISAATYVSGIVRARG